MKSWVGSYAKIKKGESAMTDERLKELWNAGVQLMGKGYT